MLIPVCTTPPDSEKPLVSLEEAKKQMLVEHGDDDELIKGYVTAATGHLEIQIGRAFIRQIWRQAYHCWPTGGARFPLSPALSIDSVQYYDSDNSLQTLDSSSYWLVEDTQSPIVTWRPGVQLPALYDRPDAMQVYMAVGYGAEPEETPEPIRLAVKVLAAEWYANREASTEAGSEELPFAVMALVKPFRRMNV